VCSCVYVSHFMVALLPRASLLCACMRACVRACVRACNRVRVRACVRECADEGGGADGAGGMRGMPHIAVSWSRFAVRV